MSILDIFRTPPAPVASQVPLTPGRQVAQVANPAIPIQPGLVQPGNIPQPTVVPQETPATPVNGVIPDQTTIVAPIDDSPLAEFQSLWEDVPNNPNSPNTDLGPTQLNPEDVAKAVAKADFTSGITPESLEAIKAGGEGAVEALIAAMNTVGQKTLSQATLVSHKLAEQMVEKALAKQAATLPDQIRSQAASNSLIESNPLFSNPAIKPIIEATQERLLGKFPTATPAEINKMTNDFLVAMGQEFAPKAPADPSAEVEMDWSKFV